MESTHELELFIKPSCPYCKKVMRYMAVHAIEIPLSDITSNPEAAEKLIEVGGKRQVPCLFIDGKPLYESDDIVAWLNKNLLQ